jgi:hypothetical protein
MRCCDSATAAKIFIMLCYGDHQTNEILHHNDHRDDDRKQLVDELAKIFVSAVTKHAQKILCLSRTYIQATVPGFHTCNIR